MYQASNQFVSKLDTSPMKARLTFSDGSVIPSGNGQNPILGFTFSGGSPVATIGCAVSVGVSVELDRNLLSSTSFTGKTVSLDIAVEGVSEWIPMGEYHVTDAPKSDDTVTLKLQDALGTVFDKPYEPIAGYDFTQGVNNISFLRAICTRRGVSVDTSGLTSFILKDGDPTGCSERSIIASIAGLAGKFACMDRSGTLCFRWYQASDASIGPDDYYDEECITGDSFTAQYLKCYNSTLAETLVQGDSTGTQGLSMNCMWCTPTRLATLWQALGGFSYTTIRNLQMLGNPLLDLGDIVQVTDYEGNHYRVPIVSIYHEYDGGIITILSAPMENSENSTAGEMRRFNAQINKRIDDMGASILQEVSGTYATKDDLTGLAKTTEVTALIRTAVDDSSSSILQKVSATYATKDSVKDFVTQTQVDASIKTAVDQKGASILQEVSGTYATQDSIKTVNAKLELKVDSEKLISAINASADVINLVGNRISISSDYFSLTPDGSISIFGENTEGRIWLCPNGTGKTMWIAGHASDAWKFIVAPPLDPYSEEDFGYTGVDSNGVLYTQDAHFDGCSIYQALIENANIFDANIENTSIHTASIVLDTTLGKRFDISESGFSIYSDGNIVGKIFPAVNGPCFSAYGSSGNYAGLGSLEEPLFFAPYYNGSSVSGVSGLQICWRKITINGIPYTVLSSY